MLWVRNGVCCCFLCERSLMRAYLRHAIIRANVLNAEVVESLGTQRGWLVQQRAWLNSEIQCCRWRLEKNYTRCYVHMSETFLSCILYVSRLEPKYIDVSQNHAETSQLSKLSESRLSLAAGARARPPAPLPVSSAASSNAACGTSLCRMSED